MEVNGTLYGTRSRGGTGCNTFGCGNVFSVDPETGAEKVLHAFGRGADGEQPLAPLLGVNTALYGTTTYGGGAGGDACGNGGCGTIFALAR
jgi:uncharacterized repeat protein (TIGR03803 family)